jgi:drug/metabolite transporter (DMT)-like permease
LFSIIVGFSFLGIKTCVTVVTPLETLTHRYNAAFIAALIPVLLGKQRINWKGKSLKLIVISIILYVGFMTLQTVGLAFSTSIESGIIFAMVPIFAKFFAKALMNETTSWKQNIFMCISVGAVIVMFILSATDITVNFTGLAILLLSSVAMASSNVMLRYVRNQFRPYEIAFFICLGGFLIFNGTTIITGLKNGTLGLYFKPLIHWEFVLSIIFLGVLSLLVTLQLMSYMMANMEAVKATLFGNLSTAISIVAGVIILQEPLRIYHIVCTALIIAGVIGINLPSMGIKAVEEGE